MTSQQNPTWMDQSWHVILTNPVSNLGVAATDVLFFDSQQMTIVRQPTTSQNRQQSSQLIQSQVWGRWTQATSNELSGLTSSGDMEFSIKYDASTGLVTCTLTSIQTSIQRSRRVRSVALGSLLGTLTGAVAGVVAGSLAVGFFAGLTAAVTSSIVASSGPGPDPVQTGSAGTWVANDGGAGGGRKMVPYPLKSASA
jgi:hypothetical protein